MFASRGKFFLGVFLLMKGHKKIIRAGQTPRNITHTNSDFLHIANIASRGGYKGRLGGLEPPTLPRSMDTSLSPPPFLGPKNELEGGGRRRREGEKEDKRDEPPHDLAAGFATDCKSGPCPRL